MRTLKFSANQNRSVRGTDDNVDRVGIAATHPTHTCLYRNQSLARMRSAFDQVAYLKIPVIPTSYACALRRQVASPS